MTEETQNRRTNENRKGLVEIIVTRKLQKKYRENGIHKAVAVVDLFREPLYHCEMIIPQMIWSD